MQIGARQAATGHGGERVRYAASRFAHMALAALVVVLSTVALGSSTASAAYLHSSTPSASFGPDGTSSSFFGGFGFGIAFNGLHVSETSNRLQTLREEQV